MENLARREKNQRYHYCAIDQWDNNLLYFGWTIRCMLFVICYISF